MTTREEFDEWWVKGVYPEDARWWMRQAWQARQPEIDALKSGEAEWDAEGNPLNLVAAAQVAYFAIRSEHGPEHHACVDLRKFLTEAP